MDNQITDEMVKYSKVRTQKHILGVNLTLRGLLECLPMQIFTRRGSTREDLQNKCLRHDNSKLHSPEYEPYVWINWKYKCEMDKVSFKYPDDIAKDTLNATKHHILNNDHHPEYFAGEEFISERDRDKSTESVDASSMSDICVIEMVCDWNSVAVERGEKSPRDWYNKNSGKRWIFTQEQKELIEPIISIIEDNDSINRRVKVMFDLTFGEAKNE